MEYAMQFDRFDICDAYYLFASLYHSGQFSPEYKIFGRLNAIGYKPSAGLVISREPFVMSDNAIAIFQKLVDRYEAKSPCNLSRPVCQVSG